MYKEYQMKTFHDLGISPHNIETIQKKGFEEPTEIQILTIPLFLKDEIDIIAQAQTGTGKTAAFALPLIEKINASLPEVQAIILAPTRELVIQICEEIHSLKDNPDMKVVPIYGGQSIDLQLKRLKRGASIIVGTPGRVLDHMRRKSLKLGSIKYFILDEADEMLNMGFIEDIESVLEAVPERRRILLFSATMPNRIKSLAENYMGKYTHIKTETQLTTHLTDQIYFEVLRRDKFEALCRIIDMEKVFYGIVFCRTKMDVDDLFTHLIERGYAADALHGDISQIQREKIIKKLKSKQITVLVATDVAARGIDINNLTHVINFSIPHNPEAYIHRIGRTGRAGNQGTAITFVTPDEFRKLGFIKRFANVDIQKKNVPDIQDVIKTKRKKINDEIATIIQEGDLEIYQKWAKKLLKNHSEDVVIASILKHAFSHILDEKKYQNVTLPSSNERRDRVFDNENQTRLFIAKGKNDGMSKASLIDFVTNQAHISKKNIEDIVISDNFSFITVPFEDAEIILNKFKNVKSGKKDIIEKAKISKRSGGGRKESDSKRSNRKRPDRKRSKRKSNSAR